MTQIYNPVGNEMKKLSIFFLFAISFIVVRTSHATPAAVESGKANVDYEKVISKSTGNKCYLESYKNNRGRAPRKLVEGLIANFTQEICFPSGASENSLGIPENDALAYYKSPAKIENLYALMIGSAMQESSGGVDCGQDSSAPENRTGQKAEAGIFQTSYDSVSKSNELRKLYEDARAGGVQCFSNLYATCSGVDKVSGLSRLKNWGSGEGVDFQATTKSCQGFAAKYHSIMLRIDRAHYGPINKKSAEMKPSCVSMFSELGAYISSNREICRSQ
ncbi:hypothetical protein [Burkholderia cenocepacia]|uniref:hypothetical protein n=1 Tax=Burkholderia cenocepacia TaxID=95486 RepID=UPI002AB100E8|nr:hypothetical protein [Burkholderia cenocepacia]